MSYHHNTSWNFTLGLMLIILPGIMFLGSIEAAYAEKRGFGHHESAENLGSDNNESAENLDSGHHKSAENRGFGHHESAENHRSGYHKFMDSRYHHNHYYPTRGRFVDVLPSGYHMAAHGNSRYYFHGGIWYRPEGRRFAVVAPPFGLIIPFLPSYYTTIRVGGIPYYYANEVYYTQTTGGYMVVDPPKGEVKQTPASEGQLFIYPRNGQSEQQQATDRYECHRWAVDQTGFDPTQPPAGLPEAQMKQKRADYQRAMGACLDARGYTVK